MKHSLYDKDNYVYPIYSKSSGFYKWVVNKRRYDSLKNIIIYLEDEYKYTNDDNILIKAIDETLPFIDKTT